MAPKDFDPDSFRMSIGEHLEELRRRFILALGGFAIVCVFCLIWGQEVTSAFCKPLIDVLQSKNLNPQIFYTQLSDGFMVFIEISLICATAISAPWILYQLWQFVAAGLYPSERKLVTRFVPLSLGLLIVGMLFVYFLVLPWTILFFIDFGNSIPLPQTHSQTTTQPTTQSVAIASAFKVPELDGDPADPQENQLWVNRPEGRLKMFFNGNVRVIPFGPQQLLAPHITLPDYIDLVVGMLITFGLSFQLPLVVMALARVGILSIEMLKSSRRYVYFGLAILSAAITPGDVITATVALMIPLILLYELGIWLSRGSGPDTSSTID